MIIRSLLPADPNSQQARDDLPDYEVVPHLRGYTVNELVLWDENEAKIMALYSEQSRATMKRERNEKARVRQQRFRDTMSPDERETQRQREAERARAYRARNADKYRAKNRERMKAKREREALSTPFVNDPILDALL